MSETAADTKGRACTWTVRNTPVGPLLLAATEEGLVNVVFHAEGRTVDQALNRLTARLGASPVTAASAVGEGPPSSRSTAPGTAPHAALALAAAQLDAYFGGELRGFTIALDWTLSGGFNERVLRELAASVPFGSTTSYQDLARAVGEPGAARAIGAAMGSNPLPVVVPCHRVVESGGRLGGFGGGKTTKQALLALEGLLPQPLF